MFLIRRNLLLRKKPGHGHRHADDDDNAPIPFLVSSPRRLPPPQQPLERRLVQRSRLVTVIIFLFFFLFALVLTSSHCRQSSPVLFLCALLFLFLHHLLFPRLLCVTLRYRISIEYLAGHSSCSPLKKRRHFLKERYRD